VKRLIDGVNQDVVIAIIRYKAASWRGFAHKQSSRHAHVSVNSDLKTAQFHFWRQGSSHATHYTLPSFFVWALLFTLNIKLYCSARDRHESISDRAQVVMGWRRPRDANGNDTHEKKEIDGLEEAKRTLQWRSGVGEEGFGTCQEEGVGFWEVVSNRI
jgi:hypothetical protein